MKTAVIGATGLVGSTMLRILEERNFPVTELIPVASENSLGKSIIFNQKSYPVISLSEAVRRRPDVALFSAGSRIALDWAQAFADTGCFVIDNSSAWRMDAGKKLVVPEVNGKVLMPEDKIIANPNCSTIQMLMVLKPLHDLYRIRRVVVSTYQSVSGSGQKGLNQLQAERSGGGSALCYPHPIDLNVLPHIDVFQDNGYTKEEMKMVLETQKILGDDTVQVSATAVRVPVMGGHSESVNIEMERDFDLNTVREALSAFPGLTVLDDPAENRYPMPIYCSGKNEVFVGRIRRDFSQPNTLNCWIVADNLRKGAATNAVQIAECLLEQGMLPSAGV